MSIDPPAILVLLCLLYTLWIIVLSRSARTLPPAYSADNLFYVFFVPCLDEERVIRTSIDRLMSLDAENFAVLVIDDGSTDSTADIVRSFDPGRVWLFQRFAPNAGREKVRR